MDEVRQGVAFVVSCHWTGAQLDLGSAVRGDEADSLRRGVCRAGQRLSACQQPWGTWDWKCDDHHCSRVPWRFGVVMAAEGCIAATEHSVLGLTSLAKHPGVDGE